jgi:ABC-type branched-subunit amino acid transport system substrate-binding protein
VRCVSRNERSQRKLRRLERFYHEERPGAPIDMNSISTFDTVLILAEALRAGATTSEEIKKFILEKRDFQGIAGTLTFDANGDAKWKSIVQLVSGGKCAPLPD